MKNLSVRTWVLMGFVISLIGIVINVFVVSALNNKIRETETELSGIKELLRTQADQISIAELQNDLSTILNHISKSQTGAEKISAGEDSIYILQNYLKRVYFAAHDIPASEVLKVDNEKLAKDIQYLEKVQASGVKEAEGNKAEAEKLMQEAEEIQKADAQTKSELAKKLDEAIVSIDADKLADKSGVEVILATIPSLKKANDQFLNSFQKKETRIKELADKKEYLSWWANLLGYLAVSLQMFGLLCVLNKDLPKGAKKEEVIEKREVDKKNQ